MQIPPSAEYILLLSKWQWIYTNSNTAMQKPLMTCDMCCKKVGQETMKESEVNVTQPTKPASSEQWREDNKE